MHDFRQAPALLDLLRQARPIWALGAEQPLVQWRHVELTLAAAPRNPALAAPAAGLLCWMWQQRPLVKVFAETLPALAPYLDKPSPKLLAMARVMGRSVNPDPDPVPESPNEPDAVLADCLALVKRPGHGLYHLGEGLDMLLTLGGLDQARELLAAAKTLDLPATILDRLTAEWALAALLEDDPHQALEIVAKVDPEIFAWWRENGLARAEDTAGDTDAATKRLLDLWTRMPWHVNLGLALHDRLNPLDADPAILDRHDVRVLLYSWNKAQVLGETLASLAKTDLGPAKVMVLDNGSSDDTGAMLSRVRAEWDAARPGSLETVTLPVNVGAPAARNWLLSLEEARNAEMVAFLDDDLLLPRDWLVKLLAAAEAHPYAGAIGCMVTDHIPPHAIQAADFHMLHPETPAAFFNDVKERVHIFQNATSSRDRDLFAYTRPCLSVTGCCHLLRTEAIQAAGPFDVSFNPSQFDDLERDLRSATKGHPCAYTGALQVRHLQHSSLRQADSPAKSAHIHGNKIKLEAKFQDKDLMALYQWDQDTAWSDWKRKTEALVRAAAATDPAS